MKAALLTAVLLLVQLAAIGGDTVRPGLEDIEWREPCAEEQALIEAVRQPLFDGLDVSAAMQDWFDGRLLDVQGRLEEAKGKWREGLGKLDGCSPLPAVVWKKWPDGEFKDVVALKMNSDAYGRPIPQVSIKLVEWKVDGLREYGLLMCPMNLEEGVRLPLMLYCHGAAYGIPVDFIPRLAELVDSGYVVVAPAMRGEHAFTRSVKINGNILKCDGDIENLEGEVDDCLSMLSAAWKLPYVRKNEFAVLGHSFGAGVGLLVAARGGRKARAVVSYDAWLVNPQRYYWDRMRRGPRNWDSWEDFCNQPVARQLAGLKKRSIIHNASMLECPLLLFMGDAYSGSVFHKSHDDFRIVLDRLVKKYRYELIPGGDHNAVLDVDGAPAKFAWKKQTEFLLSNYPSLGMERLLKANKARKEGEKAPPANEGAE